MNGIGWQRSFNNFILYFCFVQMGYLGHNQQHVQIKWNYGLLSFDIGFQYEF